ncbi:MAG: hypothetical protein KAR39_07485 [Thermoplasmata archaeon]|nr:hypothetical protein [Thermoplasmata archaeon]
MSIEIVAGHTADLLDLLETHGDIEDLGSYEMKALRDSAGAVVHILEEDRGLGHLVLGRELDHTLHSLKTLAVSMHKAISVKDRLEDIVNMVDQYELHDMVNDLHDALTGQNQED